jgi:sensor histidine kinase YesM
MSASTLSKFAKLMRMSLEMSSKKFVPLGEELTLISKYLELEQLRSSNKFSYELQIDPSLETKGVGVPTMLIQPFVENAVKHGIMHLLHPGKIHISIQLKGSDLYCYIDDNGIGRQHSAILNANIRGEHQSSGIAITLKRLKLLHKEKGTSFAYDVIDKTNANGDATGTTIIFTLPFIYLNETNQSVDH